VNVENLLRSIPLDELDDAWARRVRSEPAARRAAWIAAADALCAHPGEARARAQAAYWALRRDLDPAADADVERVRAVMLSGVPRGLDFEAFARRAVEHGEGDVALMGRIALAQCASTRGDHDAAEQALLEILPLTRGRGDWLEHKTAASLSLVFIEKGQEFEGLVFAHHAVNTLGSDADPWTRLAVHQRLCQTLRQVQDFEGLRDALERFERALDGAPSPWSRGARRYMHGLRAELALDAGLMSVARGELARMRAFGGAAVATPGLTSWSSYLEARILRKLGQPCDALVLLPRESWPHDLNSALLATACAFDLGEQALAVEIGREILSVLEAGDEVVATRGTGEHVRVAALLGALFYEHGDEDEIERRAFDEAARSALIRLLDLQRCREWLPESASVTDAQLEILKGYHRRFVAEHAVFLDRLIPFLEEELRAGKSPLDHLLHQDDFLVLCGWCHRVRDREGAWLPIGHFLPDHSSLQVTHGICPTCRAALDRDTIGG
jgi:tetratricopeptide (TPR) repeat protein